MERNIFIKKSVFISAPFFSKEQIAKVKKVENALDANPTVAYYVSPRKDQNGSGYDRNTHPYEWANEIYRKDITGIKNCDIIIEILDFDKQDTDSGTAYEYGWAKAMGKPVMTINFDKKPVNLMVGIASDYDFDDEHDIAKHDFNFPASSKYKGKMM